MRTSKQQLVSLVSILVTCHHCVSQDLVVVPQDTNDVSNEADVAVEDVIVSTDEIFVATDQWQEVKPGQVVPGGLHVRMNLETGKKEARLLQEDSAKDDTNHDDDHEALKEALKNIKSDFKESEKNKEFDPSKFRTMEELKDVLGDVELNMETDVEILTKLINQFKLSKSDEDKLTIIEDLEYYVHQYDNALLFVDQGGLKDIVSPSLNSTSAALRKMACMLLSGAAQSNPKFQIASLEMGLVDTLLRMTALGAGAFSLDQEADISTKAFSALSAIIRNFPEAQNALLRQNGLGVLINIFDKKEKIYDKLKLKILTLISDLLIEREAVTDLEDEASKMRLQQFNDIETRLSLNSQIVDHGWCQVFNKVLILPGFESQVEGGSFEDLPYGVEHDVIEKILGSMQSILTQCRRSNKFYEDPDLRKKISYLQSHYEKLSEVEFDDGCGPHDRYMLTILTSIKAVANLFDNLKHTEL